MCQAPTLIHAEKLLECAFFRETSGIRPNEIEIIHSSGVVANTLKVSRNGALGLIVWLDSRSPILNTRSIYGFFFVDDLRIGEAPTLGRLGDENFQCLIVFPDGDESMMPFRTHNKILSRGPAVTKCDRCAIR